MSLPAAVCDNFLATGDFCTTIECHLGIYIANLRQPITYTALQSQTLAKAYADYKAIEALLNGIRGRPKSECVFEEQVSEEGNVYTFKRQDFIGRHLISIRRESVDRFFWTIGVSYEGDFWKKGNGVKITGYSHVGTNGNLTDMTNALNATAHLFPSPEETDPNYNPYA